MDYEGFTTKILHADRLSAPGHGAMHVPIYTSTAYGYEDAHDLAAVFQGKIAGFAYARQGNPTATALEKKITLMEGGVETVSFATGMAGIGSLCFALLRAGDHIIVSNFLFGNTYSLFSTLQTQGIEISFVDVTNADNVAAARRENTRLVFTETVANPRTQVADLKRIGDFCSENKILYVVDNSLTTPYLFRPRSVGASLVVSSLTKSFSGHGNALGGAVTDTGLFDWTGFPHIYDSYKKKEPALWGITQIKKKGLRDFGATLTALVAHQISQGMETLALRMERACSNASLLANFFTEHPRVNKVHFPGVKTHTEYELSKSLFKYPGFIMSIELADDMDCFAFMNKLKIAVNSTHLGDNRTLAIPVAHTIYYEMGAENRAAMGISDNLIRLSIGIEDPEDLLADFRAAFQE